MFKILHFHTGFEDFKLLHIIYGFTHSVGYVCQHFVSNYYYTIRHPIMPPDTTPLVRMLSALGGQMVSHKNI